MAGAAGFLSKLRPVTEVADAVRAAYEGEPLIDPEEVHRVLQHVRRRREEEGELRRRVDRLTPRQVEILQQMADGLAAPYGLCTSNYTVDVITKTALVRVYDQPTRHGAQRPHVRQRCCSSHISMRLSMVASRCPRLQEAQLLGAGGPVGDRFPRGAAPPAGARHLYECDRDGAGRAASATGRRSSRAGSTR